MQERFADLVRRVEELPSGTTFIIADLYSPEEWAQLKSVKLPLGSMFCSWATKNAALRFCPKEKAKPQQYYKK